VDKKQIEEIALAAPELEYKENFREVITRSLDLIYGSRGVLLYTGYDRPDIPEGKYTLLEQIDFGKDPFLRIREMCKNHDRYFPLFKDLPDDQLPVAGLNFGTGAWAGMLSGRMQFASDTSWVEPWADSLEGLLNMKLKEHTRWFDIFAEGMNILNRHAKGKYMTDAGGQYSALEFVSMIRGSKHLTDMYDDSDKLMQVLVRYQGVLIDLYQRFRRELKNMSYGFSAWGSLWLPEGIVLSDDAACNISREMYRTFGVPFTGEMFHVFGMGVLHFHSLGYHQRDVISTMSDLIMYCWNPDPNRSRPVEMFDFVREGARKKIVMIAASPQQIRENINKFNEGRFVLHAWCKNKKEALSLIDFVKKNASPL